MRKKKITLDKYQQIFDLYEDGNSFSSIINKFGLDINKVTLAAEYRRYLEHGIHSLKSRKNNHSYTSEFKKSVIHEYIQTGKSFQTLAAEYNIPSHETIRKWVIKYTEGKENKTYSPKPEVYNMKARKTTLEERIEIVNYCISNEFDYKSTAENFKVKYSQVYSWVKKYNEHGETGLIDGRGKGKPTETLSTEEQLKLKLKALESRNQFLELENEALKKRKQIERQLMNQKLNN